MSRDLRVLRRNHLRMRQVHLLDLYMPNGGRRRDMTEEAFQGWVILELMGHRRLGGYVREQEIAGQAFLRIDIPGEDGEFAATQYYGASAIYCMTPTTEEIAKMLAVNARPRQSTDGSCRNLRLRRRRRRSR